MTRPLIYTPWTSEHDERLKLLSSQGATALRAAAALGRPIQRVRIRARKLDVPLIGVREIRRRLAAAMRIEGSHV